MWAMATPFLRTSISYFPVIQCNRQLKVRHWRCMAGNLQDESSSADKMEASKVPVVESMPNQGPSKKGNRIVAVVSAAAAICLFLSNRGLLGGSPGLSDLSANAIPYEEALRNGRPTVVEFYADWCEVCREMAKDVYTIEEKYKGQVNFVMLNVDNSKWDQELDEFGVEGIPHFAFLDERGNEEGNIVGKLPKKYLVENLDALVKGGDTKLPHSRVVGKFSEADNRQPSKIAAPRSHG